MKTRKIFYEDPMCGEFTARVLRCEKGENGYRVVLDATAFYPEGGGQAADVGTLGGVKVLDTREMGDQIVHCCVGPLQEGSTVAGKVDWEHRFDLMQQHTGEHILSGLLHKYLGLHNVGFHMGAELVEVDFDGPVTQEMLQKIEQEANGAVWADLPVKCWVPSPEELKKVAYRSKRELPWPVRIVEIPGFDTCACCGVHVKTTGCVGLIKILSCTKFHQGVRLEMVCGGRAYRYLARIFEENRLVSQAFSAKLLETGAAAQKVKEQLAAEKFRAAGLEKQIFAYVAESYVNQENVVHFADGLNPAGVRELAERIASAVSGYAAVFSGTDDSGYSYCLASRESDLREMNRALTQTLDGRGGGKPQFQQGSVKASRKQIQGFFG